MLRACGRWVGCLACGQFRGAWPAANGGGGLRPEIWENLGGKSEKIVIV